MAEPLPLNPALDLLRSLTAPSGQTSQLVHFHFAPGCVVNITLQPTLSEAAASLLRAP